MLLDIDPSTVGGISEDEAVVRLQAEGSNELPSAKPRGLLALAWAVVREPMLLLLVGAGIVYLLLGELKDSIVLLISIFVVLGISLYQQRKTERALEALRDLSSPRALVIRNGKEKRIAGKEVVRDDIVILQEGDHVPADALVISDVSLSVDESLLTGESVPVQKSRGAPDAPISRPGGDDTSSVFSGTLVVQGHGVAQVVATGPRTELGKIGKSLVTLRPEQSQLKREVGRVVKILATFGLSVCGLVAIIYGLTRADWLNGLLVGITMAMSLLPEEFPVVLTVFLALGAWRIARKNVLTRAPAAIEALGAATVLCVDKTGTLTQNRMAIRKLLVSGLSYTVDEAHESEDHELPEQFHELVEFGILASQRKPFDPMDLAFRQLGERFLANTEHLHSEWSLLREYPLSPKLLAVTRVWKGPDVSANKDSHSDVTPARTETIEGLVRDIACPIQEKRATARNFSLKCALECARLGSPLIILTDDGTLYMPISSSMPDQDQRARLSPFVGKYVQVRGQVFERQGTRAIMIQDITELKGVKLVTGAE